MSPRTTIPPYETAGGPTWRLDLGDCLEVMRDLADASVDALVTDPPAGIGFMGKDWDHDRGGRDAWVAWMAQVMAEARRILKPGAHALVWAIPRTSHWTATALEDAGFEIRDVLTHHFGTGFPKSLDVSKAIDAAAGAKREILGRSSRHTGGTNHVYGEGMGDGTIPDLTAPATPEAERWQGWGTALKPASEHWILARFPLAGTVAANVITYGTGGLNVDATRIEGAPRLTGTRDPNASNGSGASLTGSNGAKQIAYDLNPLAGRWPTNVVFTHAPDCSAGVCVEACPVRQLDEQSGEVGAFAPVKGTEPTAEGFSGVVYGKGKSRNAGPFYGDAGAASRFYPVFRWYESDFLYTPKPATTERDQGLEGYSLRTPGELTDREEGSAGISARAGARGRRRNFHPTVKPIDLMRWLCRLVTPAGGVVFDPFAGSGTTLAAALREGFHAIGVEQDPDYYALAESRIIGDSPLFNLGARIIEGGATNERLDPTT